MLLAYETSICKAQVARRGLAPMGNILLSSQGRERRVIGANTFKGILEMDLRQERISQALECDMFNAGAPPMLGPLTARQQSRYLELMRASLCHCDHIADIAANCRQDGSADPFTKTYARMAQIEYIESLATKELAGLFYTIDMAGFGFVRGRKYEAEDPLVWEKITVFEECLLRHGSWFLWAHIQGGQASHMSEMMSTGMKELIDWETGKEGVAPGLRMSLVEAYRKRLEDAEDADDAITLEASLRELIRSEIMAPVE